MKHFFQRFSLQQRFLVAPLLGLVVYGLVAAAFIYESKRQNAGLSDITNKSLAAFNQYSAVFAHLTEQHLALYELLYNAGHADEATLYDQTKLHLYKIQKAIEELEQTLQRESGNAGMQADFIALRNTIRKEALTRTHAYRDRVTAALRMATTFIDLAPQQLTLANERFTAMNVSLLAFLEMERDVINQEILVRVRNDETNSAVIAFAGVSITLLLIILSVLLARLLSRSIQTQINALTKLGEQAGARFTATGSNEVERMTHAIGAFRQALLELRESERRFSDLLQNVKLVSMMLDSEARITFCNEYLLRLTGRQRAEVIGKNWFEIFIPPDQLGQQADFAAFLTNSPEAWHIENEIITRTGERRLIRWNNSLLHSGSGEMIGTASIGEDITEQKRAELRIKRLNRVYAVLSGINMLIVRVSDRDQLFQETCRIAVEEGAFKMAWIGAIDPHTLDGTVVAWHGCEAHYINQVRLTARAGTPDSARPASCAVRQLQAVISNDIAADPSMVLREELLSKGHKSAGYFPLMVAGQPVAVLALFAGETGIFDDEEMRLLRELADDISFALNHLEKQERLNFLAYYDPLTRLANRTLFHERLQQGVLHAQEQGRKLALVLMDIERFKTINDTFGRQAGDALLKTVAGRMSEAVADASRLGRLDADHFAILVMDVQSGEELAHLIEHRSAEIFGPPFRIGDADLRLSAKFGIALFPADGPDADTLFRNAEAALKNTKTSGEQSLFYTRAMNARVAEKLTLENQLRQALEQGEFVLHYQPKINLVSGKLTGAEALIRWNNPRTGLVPPGHFIPILEETGLINEVGRWALRQTLADFLRWRAAGLAAVRIAVNVSPLQLRHRDFIAEIKAAIGIDPHAAAGLELEITESLIMENIKHSIEDLKTIRALGVTIAIDDFGTGFSSLSYLAKLPVDTLKIDRSFVIDMTAGPEGLALVSTIINLAHSLRLKVVAEGVETEEQSRLLRLLNCDEMQGYLFSKPVPGDIFESRFLARPA